MRYLILKIFDKNRDFKIFMDVFHGKALNRLGGKSVWNKFEAPREIFSNRLKHSCEREK